MNNYSRFRILNESRLLQADLCATKAGGETLFAIVPERFGFYLGRVLQENWLGIAQRIPGWLGSIKRISDFSIHCTFHFDAGVIEKNIIIRNDLWRKIALVNQPSRLWIYFDYLAIIRHQAIHFDLDIRCLRVDCSAQTLFNHRQQFSGQFLIRVGQFFNGLIATIAPIFFLPPGMTRNWKPQSAIFAQNSSPIRLVFGARRTRVAMNVIHVPNASISPTAGRIHQPGRVVAFNPAGDFFSLELSPSFIERHPHHNAGMIESRIDHGFQFRFKLNCRYFRTLNIRIIAADIFIAGWHVLPHQ